MVTPGTPAWLRTRNDRSALHLLLDHGALTRSGLSRLSGLSRPTAGQMLSRLRKAGLITATGTVSRTRGPRATVYAVRPDSATGVAITIVGDAVTAMLVDPTDAEHPAVTLRRPIPTTAGRGRTPATDVRAAVAAACEAGGVAASTVRATVIGVHAAVTGWGDGVRSGGLPGWPATGARSQIERDTGLTALIENSVNLAAHAERDILGAAEPPSFAYVWLGEHVGVGVDIGGAVYSGAFHGAGHVEHLEVPRAAARFDPAAADFAELLGGNAIVRMLRGSPTQRLDDILPRLGGDLQALDELAARVELLVSIILGVLDPAVFILGGPTGRAGGPRLAELVQARVAARRDRRAGAQPASAQPASAQHHVAVRMSASGPTPILQGARMRLVAQLRARLDDIVAEGTNRPTITKR